MPTPTLAELASAALGGLESAYGPEHYSYSWVLESRREGGQFVDYLVLTMVQRETGRGFALEMRVVPLCGRKS